MSSEGEQLTVVVPAADAPSTLAGCLAAIRGAEQPPQEVIVVDFPPGAGPAACRNFGALQARNPIVMFVDADVLVHRDAFIRVRAALAENPRLVAVFGAYDDQPAAPGVVSTFRNLLHHHVHREAAGPATTFCSALGAIRREALLAVGGFDDRRYARASIEDIELGGRLIDRGGAIVLDPDITGTHLKAWTLRSMLVTDLLHRGIPWVALLARRRQSSRALNLGWRHRGSAGLTAAALAGLATRRRGVTLVGVLGMVFLNRAFYRLLLVRRGPRMAAAGIALHALHHAVSLLALPGGAAAVLAERVRAARLPRAERAGSALSSRTGRTEHQPAPVELSDQRVELCADRPSSRAVEVGAAHRAVAVYRL